MELGSLTVTAPPAPQRRCLSMGLRVEGSLFRCVLVVACALFCLATCKPCLLNSIQQSAANDECGRCADDHIVGSKNIVAVDTGFELAGGGSKPQMSTESICANDRPDCSLPAGSTQDSRSGNSTWPSGMGVFRLLNGRTVSCSLNAREGSAKAVNFGEDFEQSVEVFGQDRASLPRCPRHSDKQTGISTKKNSGMKKLPPVDVHPPVLDWGEKHIYSVSLAFLTMANTCNKSMLTVYEPFSSNSQFYPCNFGAASLGPGEVASLCFVFTPRSLGFTSGQVMLQTSSGGFFTEVKGLAFEFRYNISPLVSSLVPHNENLRVKEVSAWILASRGKISHQTEATCWLENSKDPDGNSPLDDLGAWLIVGNTEANYPLMAMRPQGKWEVGAHHTETLVEIDFSYGFQGQMLGSFCIHLLRPSLNMSDMIVVPVEVDSSTHLVSVSLEILPPCDASSTTLVANTIKNRAPYMLSVVEITEVAAINILQIKYINGHLLFPGSATQVAAISWNQLLSELFDTQKPKTANTKESCKLVLLTNDSSSPPAEADEFILESWKSQGTTSSMSVLDMDKISFPKVQVGAPFARWISVKNPSEEPVVMQLIHNSAQIVDESSADDGSLQPSETRNGFSVADGAATEAYVQPHGIASLGPIVFHATRQCRWRSTFFILLVIFYVSRQVTDYGYQDHSHNDDKTSPAAVPGTGKTFHMPRDSSRSKLSALAHLDSLLSSPGKVKSSKDDKHPKSQVPAREQTEVQKGNEKGRRRRKRRGLNGVLNVLEVSSSHSENSTPSSPMSPLASTTPSSSSPSPDMDHSEARSPFSRAIELKATLQEPKASASHRMDDSLSSIASTSTIAPHARAPGSKLCNRKAVSVEDKVGDEYRYDIWGDHLSGLNVTGRSKDVHAVKTAVTKSDSNSFFVRGPQALMGGKSQPKYVSCFRPEG